MKLRKKIERLVRLAQRSRRVHFTWKSAAGVRFAENLYEDAEGRTLLAEVVIEGE